MSGRSTSTATNLNDSRIQALRALISSLAPNASSKEKKLSVEQVGALSDRLGQILGLAEEGPEVRRNEKGELLNEEGLPIIEVSEPLNNVSGPSQSPEAFLSDHDPPPFSRLSREEKLQLRIKRDHILDSLEEEEERELEKDSERERRQKIEEVAKMDAESRAAARGMQKKMGKALLKDFAVQQEKVEKEIKKAPEATAVETHIHNGESSCRKPKKSVSFANVPDVDEERPKPKPPVAWGDISVAKLKARLKPDILSNQPMKLEVIERVPGIDRTSASRERDSDDESSSEEQCSEIDGKDGKDENDVRIGRVSRFKAERS